MEIKPLRTVRFTNVVEESGKPIPITLWTEPEEDRDFAKALRGERVLTVIQRNAGAKADYGLVGLFKEPLATYLVFPKKLQHPPETKVIGIKYEQLAEAKPKGPLHRPKARGRPGIPMREAATQRKVNRPKQPGSKDAFERDQRPERPQRDVHKPPPEPRLYRFGAKVEITLRQVLPVEVEARTAKEAAQLVKEKMAALQPDLASAALKRRASALRKI
jgi:hypothetical protein